MKKLVFTALILTLAGCAGLKPGKEACPPCPPCPAAPPELAKPPTPPEEKRAMFIPAQGDIPLFEDKDTAGPLLKVALLNRKYFEGLKGEISPYDFAGRKVTAKELAASTEEFIDILRSSPTAADLDRLVKEKFDIYQMAGQDSTGTVVFSSYYEPTIEASLKKSEEYKYPIFARPPDLFYVDLGRFNPKFKGEKITGMIEGGELVPYLDRDLIDFQGALDGKGLELAWFRDRADVMDLHIEGSGRLQLPDGGQIKALFAATNSLKFKGWLTALIEAGALPRKGISHEKGKQYLLDHPEQVREVLTKNPRYTFFRLQEITDPEEGPNGTYGLPLVGWRSVAMDNNLVPMGALAFMRTEIPDVDDEGTMNGFKQDSRFVFVQDTGGAIKGPGRVDFFAGNGKKSHSFAFKLWNRGQMYLLVLKEPPAAETGGEQGV